MKKADYIQFHKLISRVTPFPLTPEVRLVLAVLSQAWDDADSDTNNREAVRFFVDGRAGVFAGLLGIDADFIKETFMKHHPKSYEALPYVS
jgi:hypothetical protein